MKCGLLTGRVKNTRLSFVIMPVTCLASRFPTHLVGSAFGPQTFFTILIDGGALTERATRKRVE